MMVEEELHGCAADKEEVTECLEMGNANMIGWKTSRNSLRIIVSSADSLCLCMK